MLTSFVSILPMQLIPFISISNKISVGFFHWMCKKNNMFLINSFNFSQSVFGIALPMTFVSAH
jgi:hypothetical protein